MFSSIAGSSFMLRTTARCLTLFFLLQIQSGFSLSDLEMKQLSNLDGLPLSTPKECARQCKDGERPKNCHYEFYMEHFHTMGVACYFGPNNSTSYNEEQCISADGVPRSVLSINRMIPGPSIQVCLNDKIIVTLTNEAEGVETTLHWHGVEQKGSPYQDGVPMITQCPIGSPTTYRYSFAASNKGTHFYHSHVAFQMTDGINGALIVRAPPCANPHYKLYDEDLPEHVIIIADWFYSLTMERFPGQLTGPNLGQAARSFLINGRGRTTDPQTGTKTDTPLTVIRVTHGKRYRIRIINSCSTVCLVQFSIQKHNMTLISLDGNDIEATDMGYYVSGAGERFDIILTADQPVDSYWIIIKGLGECKGIIQLAILRYDGAPEQPSQEEPSYDTPLSTPVGLPNPLNMSECGTPMTPNSKCLDYKDLQAVEEENKKLMKPKPDLRFKIYFDFRIYDKKADFRGNTRNRFFVAFDRTVLTSQINNVSFTNPDEALLLQDYVSDEICGTRFNDSRRSCTNVYLVPYGSVVELVLCDIAPLPDLAHPFHLHGYSFAVFDTKFISNETIRDEDVNQLIANHTKKLWQNEYRKPRHHDTVIVPYGSCIIMRFFADNVGDWLFHCHFLVHEVTGMTLVFRVYSKWGKPQAPPGMPQCSDYIPRPDFSDSYSDDTCSNPWKKSYNYYSKKYGYGGK
ncbi:hypothetical protein KM043_015240 [Ampulex compressa]|nr:hypothetical protein KM043_015240 [Ampulex compressa]